MTSTLEVAEASPKEAANKGPSIKLKASLAPMTALELSRFNAEEFESELSAKIAQAPGFFENLPVVIGLEKFQDKHLDFAKLISICEKRSIKAIAVRGATEELASIAKASGLGILTKQKDRSEQDIPTLEEKAEAQAPAPDAAEPKVIKEEVVKLTPQISKVVQHPIRSGQQVYAADGDLIVLASVSAGAEILADGNIHVYGALRGRALAGVKGNAKARIFCHSLGAELVSIAGQYKISEDIPVSSIGKPSQISLEDDALKFKELEL